MRRSLIALVLTSLIVGFGCHDSRAGGSTPPRAAEPVAPAVPAAEPTAPPKAEALAIGWAEIPGPTARAARDEHRAGLVHHAAGRYEPAIEGFRRALALDPTFAWARYDLARALARHGQPAEAVTEMQLLLLADLPTFGPAWATEEDLATAHASAEGQRLDAQLPTIREAYRQAIATGVPAMTYQPRERLDAEGLPQIPYEELRLGVYLPEAHRFVPAVPHVPQALGGYLDREADRALVLAGDLVRGDIWVVQARRVDVAVFDLADPGRVVLQASDVDELRPETDQPRVAVEATVEGDDARVTLQQLRYDRTNTLSLHVTTNGVELTREAVPASATRVHVDANGAFVDVPPPAGLSLEGARLRVHDRRQPFELGAGHDAGGHRHVARTPHDGWAVVFTEVAGCKEVAYTSHVLDRIDVDHHVVTRLAAEPTHGGVALGPDGSVYLDAEGHVVRFPAGSATPVADVLPGVRFTLPDYDRDCSV